MSGASAVLRRAGAVMSLGLWALGAVAMAAAQMPAAVDLTGVYSDKDAELAILQGKNESLVYYAGTFPQGQSVGTCECNFVVQQQSADRWTLKDTDNGDGWTLRWNAKTLILESTGAPQCCGAGYPGKDIIDRTGGKPPASCKVTAAKAFFHDGETKPRKAYVVSGDTVQAYIPGTEPDFVPGRFQGPKAATAGLLKREQLSCQAASAPAVQADEKKPTGAATPPATPQPTAPAGTKPAPATGR